MAQGKLYLLPNTLGNSDLSQTIPPGLAEIVAKVQVYIVEDLRNARRYLKNLHPDIDIDALDFWELNAHTPPEEIPGFLSKTMKGADTAILSEAGVPGVADPGAVVVRLAHEKGIQVIPVTGPSSILLSLMASGLNGQAFTFHGYLPIKRPERIKKISELEQVVKRKGETQIFIEAPYRNDGLLSDLLDTCNPSLLLTVAADITLDSELIKTRTIRDWKKNVPSLHKRPAIFLLGV
jgi:16S rRNA (cytidine1402-2'-O)-methyltransferase